MSAELSVKRFGEKAAERKPLHIAFLGGSLTWGANSSDPQKTSYRGLMMQYLRDKYPETPITFHDAAIGGTGSQLGLFRIDRDVLPYHPDLVFYDFTVNDNASGTDVQSLASYERILRDLLASGAMVMPVMTTVKDAVAQPDAPLPPRYKDHQKLADAYHLPAANIATYIRAKVKAGTCKPDEIWNIGKDMTHPGDEGYRLYFEAVRDRFEQALTESTTAVIPEKTIFDDLYPKRRRYVLVDHPLPAGWKRQHTYRTALWFDGMASRWMGDIASAQAANKPAALEIAFEGSLVGIFGERNGFTPPIKIWIDGKPITSAKESGGVFKLDTSRISPPAKGSGNLFLWQVISNHLTDGPHALKIEPIFDGTSPDAEFHIESICSAGR